MSWGTFLSLLALICFGTLLLYPFRIRIRYLGDKTSRSPIEAWIKVVVWWPLPLSIQDAGDTKGRADSSNNANAQELQSAEGRTRPVRPWRSLVGVVRVLFTQPGRRAKRPPSLRRGLAPHLMRAIHTFDRLEWTTELGTGDAATTAWALGALWTAKSTLYALLAWQVRFTSAPAFHVKADWHAERFNTTIDCIFRLRIGEIILAGIGEQAKAWKKGASHFGLRKGSSH